MILHISTKHTATHCRCTHTHTHLKALAMRATPRPTWAKGWTSSRRGLWGREAAVPSTRAHTTPCQPHCNGHGRISIHIHTEHIELHIDQQLSTYLRLRQKTNCQHNTSSAVSRAGCAMAARRVVASWRTAAKAGP